MKLSFVELCGFRGFRDRTRFSLAKGFVVFAGRNGVGKSTVLDAIDFALTGTISKFSVKEAKGGGLGQHIWWLGAGKAESHYVAVGFVDDDGKEFVVRRSRERGIESGDVHIEERLVRPGFGAEITADTIMRTALIRDELISALSLDLPEQARFAAVKAAIGSISDSDLSKRTEAIRRAAEAERTAQSVRVSDAKAELGRTLAGLTEARSVAERSSNVAEALALIASTRLPVQEGSGGQVEAIRNLIADRRLALQNIEEAQKTLAELLPEKTHLESEGGRRDAEAAQLELEHAANAKAVAEQNLELATRLDDAERESDVYAAHLASIIEHGSALGLQEGHCPLCRSVRTREEFEGAIAVARQQLAERGQRLAKTAAQR